MSLYERSTVGIGNDLEFLLDGRSFIYTSVLTLAASGVMNLHILTDGRDCFIQYVNIRAADAAVQVQGFAESTVTANGTEATPRNKNRQSSATAVTRLFSGPTISADGVELVNEVIYSSASPGQAQPADSNSIGEYLLKRKSSNILRLTNLSGTTAARISIKFSFVEVDH